jgi:histidine triad (HIT) family protein
MPTIFTKIINREIPSYIVWENDEFISFLDTTPVKKGHLLLVPKVEIDKVYDLDDEFHAKLFAKGREMAKKMDQALRSKKQEMQVARIGYVVEGFGVPHTHLHLVPLSAGNDLNPQNAYQAGPEELAEMRDFYVDVFNE